MQPSPDKTRLAEKEGWVESTWREGRVAGPGCTARRRRGAVIGLGGRLDGGGMCELFVRRGRSRLDGPLLDPADWLLVSTGCAPLRFRVARQEHAGTTQRDARAGTGGLRWRGIFRERDGWILGIPLGLFCFIWDGVGAMGKSWVQWAVRAEDGARGD